MEIAKRRESNATHYVAQLVSHVIVFFLICFLTGELFCKILFWLLNIEIDTDGENDEWMAP